MYSIIKTQCKILIFIFVPVWCVIAGPDKYTDKPKTYFKPFCGSPPRSYRLINGLTQTSLPYQWIVPVMILYNPYDDAVNTKLCTGTIIHHSYVLTAASCFKDIKDKVSKIRIGYNIVNITELYAGKSMQEIRVYLDQNLFLHPEYYVYQDRAKNSYSIYDFALIKLDVATSIQPVCMPYNLENPYGFPYENSVLSVYSWGKIAEIADYPEYLAGTKFRVTTDYECQNEYSNQHYDPRYLLCGKNTKIKTCIYRGDAGAGLYFNDRGIIVLAGIATNNHNDESCKRPDYFQRVAGSIGWVRSIVMRQINS